MSKATPGPWSINNWPQANSDITIGAIGTPRIAIVPLRDLSINEQKDNARLIAAAPALRDALATARSCIETPGDLTPDEIRHVLEDIEIALLLADGDA